MSSLLSSSLILGAATPAEPRVVATLSQSFNGLLLVVGALAAVWLAMVLVRLAIHRFRLPVSHADPVLVPVMPTIIPPEVAAVIAAAVAEVLDDNPNIVSITPIGRAGDPPSQQVWSSEGRRQHFASHKVR